MVGILDRCDQFLTWLTWKIVLSGRWQKERYENYTVWWNTPRQCPVPRVLRKALERSLRRRERVGNYRMSFLQAWAFRFNRKYDYPWGGRVWRWGCLFHWPIRIIENWIVDSLSKTAFAA